MVSGSVPLVTVFETSRSSIMIRVVPTLRRSASSTAQTLSATMRAPAAVGMDAVALVQRLDAGDALQQERHERARDTARASAG